MRHPSLNQQPATQLPVKYDQSVTTGVGGGRRWYPGNVVAPGFIAIGSGLAGLSAAETFRSKHPNIPVRILTTDPALPYAKPPLSKAYICGREAKLDLTAPAGSSATISS